MRSGHRGQLRQPSAFHNATIPLRWFYWWTSCERPYHLLRPSHEDGGGTALAFLNHQFRRPALSDSELPLRKQGRQSFTVEVKTGPMGSRTSIPAKPSRVPRKGMRAVDPASPIAAVFAQEVFRPLESGKAETSRRILPSLIAWEPAAPEAEPELVREPPLPRVRRVLPAPVAEEAPRRRGRPRKVATPVLTDPDIARAAPTESTNHSPSAPVAAVAEMPVRRSPRIEAAGLSRADRWKRRLPRACW